MGGECLDLPVRLGESLRGSRRTSTSHDGDRIMEKDSQRVYVLNFD